jgi:hypothetical protein
MSAMSVQMSLAYQPLMQFQSLIPSFKLSYIRIIHKYLIVQTIPHSKTSAYAVSFDIHLCALPLVSFIGQASIKPIDPKSRGHIAQFFQHGVKYIYDIKRRMSHV